jgi:hypothetical protein
MTKTLKWLTKHLKKFKIISWLFPKPRRLKKNNDGADAEEAGRWYFKRDILDCLEEYFVCIRRMKKTDPEGYQFYRKIGAVIMQQNKMKFGFRLSPLWRSQPDLPSFGAIAQLHTEDKDNKHTASTIVPIKIGYFRKLEKPSMDIEPAQGIVYEATVFHHRIKDKNLKASSSFFIEIRDGRVFPLQYAKMVRQTIQHRDASARKHSRRTTVLHHKEWTYGYFLEAECKETPKWNEMPVKDRAEFVFCFLVNSWETCSAALRVSAKNKSGLVASFGVDLLRTPYFFDQREPIYADEGHKKRIFHIVRTHKRTLKNGATSFVKSHFRGLRKFDWFGYKILISMPGTHYSDLTNLTAGLQVFDEDETVPNDMLTDKQFSDRVSKYLSQ